MSERTGLHNKLKGKYLGQHCQDVHKYVAQLQFIYVGLCHLILNKDLSQQWYGMLQMFNYTVIFSFKYLCIIYEQ